MTKTFFIFSGLAVSGSDLSFSNVNILEGISQYLLYMCSEPLVMNIDNRVLGFTSTKVKLMSFLY